MNPLLRKEIRLLLPAWLIALLLACVSPWAGGWVPAWVIGATVLAVTAFGRETTLGTLSAMLADPVPRERVFQVKAALLAVALASVLGVFWLSYAAWLERFIGNQSWMDEIMAGQWRREQWGAQSLRAAWLAAIFAGGLWTTLVFRHMLAAFWVTLLVPGYLALGTMVLGAVFGIENTTPTLLGALIIYSLAGMVWSWRLFQRTEDTPLIWSSRLLPSLGELAGMKHDAKRRRVRHPIITLLRLEISLHQAGLIGAGVLLLLNLGSLGIRASGMLLRTSDIYKMLDATGILWLLVPLIAGASAIAEERRLGTLEGRLCQPVSQRRHYFLKLGVAAILGLLLGAGALLLTEFAAYWLGLGGAIDFSGGFREDVLQVFATSLGLVLIGFYVSSLSRSSLQALGAAIGIGLAGVLSFEMALAGDRSGFVWAAWLPLLASLFLVMMILAYRNLTYIHCGLRRIMTNFAIIVTTLSTVATLCAGIYWRAWELVIPLEPDHGRPVIAEPGTTKMVSTVADFMVLLPDGRLWISGGHRLIRIGESAHGVPAPGRFLDGSNWTDIAASRFQSIGLRSDGTLWSIRRTGRTGRDELVEDQPRQIGAETNWGAIAAGHFHLLALKSDGSLWGWGDNGMGQLTGEHEGIVNEPVRIGEDSDWVKVLARYGSSVAVKEDGTWWHWGSLRELREGVGFGYITYPDPVRWEISFDPKSVKELVADLLLRADGSLWVVGQVYAGEFDYPRDLFTRTPVRVGAGHLWEDIDFSGGLSVGVTADGALLQGRRRGRGMFRVSRHSDWIAVSTLGETITALAADGTIRCWLAYEDSGEAPAPRRRPLTSFNIFDEPE